MAKYKSKYPSLGFYVDGRRHKFAHGQYETSDKNVQAVLDNLIDARRVDEPKQKAEAAKSAKSSAK